MPTISALAAGKKRINENLGERNLKNVYSPGGKTGTVHCTFL